MSLLERGSWKMITRKRAGRSDDDYLERFYLLSIRGRALFLHRFWASDQEGYHDHPWNWGRLVIHGAYVWGNHDGSEYLHERGIWGFFHGEQLHRLQIVPGITRKGETIIILPGDTWTLFWHGKRYREWGFMDYEGKWEAAEETGAQDKREMVGWLFPRFVE